MFVFMGRLGLTWIAHPGPSFGSVGYFPRVTITKVHVFVRQLISGPLCHGGLGHVFLCGVSF